jgi:hypothetical protein
MTTEHRKMPPIANTTTFDAQRVGPFVVPLTMMVALTDSLDYPPSRITLCSVIGNIALTTHQAAQLRDQLDEAIAAVLASCPAMSAPDGMEPRSVARG